MKRGWFLALALSLGLNAGLLYVTLSSRGGERAAGRGPGVGDEERGPGGTGRTQPSRPADDFEAVIRHHLDRMTRDLHLDDRQRTSISAVHEAMLPRITAVRREMEVLRGEVAGQYARPTIDPREFRALVRKLSDAQARLDSLVTEAILGEAAALTFDQRERYLRQAPWGSQVLPAGEAPQDPQQKSPGETRDRPAKGPRAEPGGPRPEPGGPRPESGRPSPEPGGPRAEPEGPRPGSGGPLPEPGAALPVPDGRSPEIPRGGDR